MGLLDKFKKKKQPQFNQMYGPNPYLGYQQHNPNLQNPYDMRPQFQQRPPYPLPQPSQYPYQQNYFPPSQQPLAPQQVYYQHPVAQQPQLQYNQNKLLQPVPFQNQPVIQSHQSNGYQQQSAVQSQYPMTGQPPEKKESESPGFFSRMLGGDTSITGIIGGMQRAVQTAQQVTPMIQQYGPAVKNLPSLYKIFKAVNTDDPGETKKSDKNKETNSKSSSPEMKKKRKIIKDIELESIDVPEKKEDSMNPKPKLFM
ncbi:VrrA/YqfQ family protein [Bacillus sp. EAC]|uniref:VrrA/YqfQ family protein n=1 Tax=Bacillus sp. EAC TaxID=1978338 RepID=UPI000B448AE7|nr:VrrA/YqfQ family protein [Bacillus sp. EAC]